MNRAYYSSSISTFCEMPSHEILGEMVQRHGFALEEKQRDAWLEQTRLLQDVLASSAGSIHLEFSMAERLKPYAVDVKSPVNPVHWFLNGKDDVRSSYYLEDVATEFHVQGLELDWACVAWDADFRYAREGWQQWSFRGKRWQKIRQVDRLQYQKNAYRVLLTRARQGMVVVVPDGDDADPTRTSSYYDATFEYLRSVGLPVL